MAHPADWAERGEVDYQHRDRTLLVRDADVDRVAAVVSGAPVAHDNNMRGLTRLEFSPDERRTVEEACADIDRAHGEGVATPDHVLYVCVTTPLSGHGAGGGPGRRAARSRGVRRAARRRGRPRGDSRQRLAPGRGRRARVARRRHGRDGESDRRLPAPHSSLRGPRDVHRPVSRGPWRPRPRCGSDRIFAKFGAIFESDLVKQIVRRAQDGRGGHLAVVRHLTAAMTFRCWVSRSWRSGCGARPDRSW